MGALTNVIFKILSTLNQQLLEREGEECTSGQSIESVEGKVGALTNVIFKILSTLNQQLLEREGEECTSGQSGESGAGKVGALTKCHLQNSLNIKSAAVRKRGGGVHQRPER